MHVSWCSCGRMFTRLTLPSDLTLSTEEFVSFTAQAMQTQPHTHTHKSGTRKAYASICTQLLRKGLTTVKVNACVGTTTP